MFDPIQSNPIINLKFTTWWVRHAKRIFKISSKHMGKLKKANMYRFSLTWPTKHNRRMSAILLESFVIRMQQVWFVVHKNIEYYKKIFLKMFFFWVSLFFIFCQYNLNVKWYILKGGDIKEMQTRNYTKTINSYIHKYYLLFVLHYSNN